ncbi:helix-turn-helix transcriptional regulator [Pedobacter panaciterrae]|jgi:AraC-type DNA-binding domain-containing proteins|uniref:AraC family transcriptional regulator n=1 Tax=Pedobacter panaciterrae TaxID=363849 RepID=A0ABU8NN44_9SPHI|nr:AraC family transcriptional regulator [Pedobacter panaciterrae]NQX53290.1 helix-turn-helix transcriptional regulator [Pedobacter panaciterrae]
MKEVIYRFGVETDWVEELAVNLGGFVRGNFIIVPDDILTGTYYTLQISENITVMLVDVIYHQDVLYKVRNIKNDFAGIYFNLTEGDLVHVMDDISRSVGRWNYNLAITDSQLDIDFVIKSGSKSYGISLFLKKHILREYLSKTGILDEVLNRVFDQKQNTLLHYAHMSSNSWHIINEFRKSTPGSISFNLLLSGLAYNLLADCLDNIMKREIMISKVLRTDLAMILNSQTSLIKKQEGIFPGITSLAAEANMSATKYKKLYKKITGQTPNAFFLNNKLELARDLLGSGQYTIRELAEKLNFTSTSHLSEQFKSYFGMSPKEYAASL